MGITWGIISVFAVTLSLCVAIFVGLIIHSRKIKESEAKFRTLFCKVFDAIFLIDSDGIIVDINGSACKLTGYSRDELMGMRFGKLVRSALLTRNPGENSSENKDELTVFGETELKNKNKDSVHVEIGSTIIIIKGERYVLASLRDVHARKIAEMEVERKNVAMRHFLTHLEEERRSFRNEIARTVDTSLLPALRKLVNDDGSANLTYYGLLENNLQKLAVDSGADYEIYSKLSPREIEICNLIKNGASSKKIANSLNISIITVNKHRERIRKKLHISNKSINLYTFLNSM